MRTACFKTLRYTLSSISNSTERTFLSLSTTVYVPGVVTSEKSNHQTLSPEDVSVAPSFQAASSPSLTDLPVDLARTEYFVPGVNAAVLSYPVWGERITATFCALVR